MKAEQPNPRWNPGLLLERVAERVTARVSERLGTDLWNRGGKQLVQRALKDARIPNKSMTIEEIAETAGVLKKR